jgi:hypothetical protein
MSSQGGRFYLRRGKVQRQEDHGLGLQSEGTGIHIAELEDEIVRKPASSERGGSGSGRPTVSAQGSNLRVDGGNPFYVNW